MMAGMTEISPGLASRYRCERQLTAADPAAHTSGLGQPRARQTACRACGAPIVTERGRYGVFIFNPEGSYPADAALSAVTDYQAAMRFAEAGNLVVRWIPSEEQ